MSEPTSNDLPVSEGGRADDPAVGARERLHPLFLLSGLAGSLKGVGGAYAVLAYMFVSGRATTALLMTVGILLVSLVAVYLYWRNFEYRVGGNEIRIDSGILSRTHRSIPFDRIQDVDISQGPFARLVGIAQVKLETGASSGPKSEEGVLRAIALERAEELRSLIRSRRAARPSEPAAGAGETAAAPGEPVYAMGLRRLLLAGTFNFSLALFAGLFGLTQTLGDVMGFDPFSRAFWERALSAGDPVRAFILSNRLAAAVAGVVVLVVVGVLTGIARTALRDWGFRLDRTEVGLRRRRGLATITDVTLPVRRVQAAILASGPIRDSLGFCQLKLQNLGHDEGGGDHEVAPLATAAEANRILGEIGWRAMPETVDWRRVSKAFVWSFLLALSPLLIPLAAVQLAVAPLLGLAGLLVPLALWLARHLEWTRLGYRLDGDRLLIRAGWWSRRTTILPLAKIQSVDLRESFISRLFGTASLHFGVAGATMFAGAIIPAIPRREARQLRGRLLGLRP